MDKETGETTRVDAFGKETSAKRVVLSNLYPIYFDTLKELSKDNGLSISEKISIAILAFAGMGTNTKQVYANGAKINDVKMTDSQYEEYVNLKKDYIKELQNQYGDISNESEEYKAKIENRINTQATKNAKFDILDKYPDSFK